MGLDDLLGRVAGRFGRVEPRRRARAFVLGLLGDVPRKNCWTVAEHAGDGGPRGMQRLLSGAVWDHEGVLADVRDYVVDHLGDTDAVLVVVDETAVRTPSMTGTVVHTVFLRRPPASPSRRVSRFTRPRPTRTPPHAHGTHASTSSCRR